MTKGILMMVLLLAGSAGAQSKDGTIVAESERKVPVVSDPTDRSALPERCQEVLEYRLGVQQEEFEQRLQLQARTMLQAHLAVWQELLERCGKRCTRPRRR